jgi:hypothetical protein
MNQPGPDALIDYVEVFELPELNNVILLASVIKEVASRSVRAGMRLRQLLKDPRGLCHYFDDIHCKSADAAAENDRSQPRAVSVAHWYFAHLRGQVPIVVIFDATSTSQNATSDASTATSAVGGSNDTTSTGLPFCGIQMIPASAYFPRVWAGNEPVMNLFASLASTCRSAIRQEPKSRILFPRHWKDVAVFKGLAGGELVKGVLHVNRFNNQEAYVRGGFRSDLGVTKDVLISSRESQNRALHGDTVAIKILPLDQWQARGQDRRGAPSASTRLSSNPGIGLV